MALKGLEGLSAEDRAAWEKKYSSQIQGQDAEWVDRFYKNIQFKEKFGNREDFEELKKMSPSERDAYYEASLQEPDYATDILLDEEELEDSVSVQNSLPSDVIYTDTYNEVEKELDLNSNIEDYMEKSAVYQMALAKNKGEYDEYTFLKDKATRNIKTRAEEISSYYKKYKDTEYLPFTDADWANMAAEYNAKSQAFGEDEANNWLRWQMQNTASENQGVLEKYWRGFTGMGASAAGALVSTAGMLYGLEEYIAGDYEDVEGLSTFGNIINAMMDNSVTRYGNDITKWGSLSIAKQREAEELGISNLEIIQKESDITGTLAQQIFNINTLPVAIQQGGFTVASMATGWGAAKLAGLMFKGAKIASMAGKAGNTTQKLLQARKALETVQKAENFTNKFIIPGVVGTTEGVVNGLNTKLETYEEATRLMTNTHMEAVNNLFQELSAKYKDIDPNILYKQAWDAYAPQYEESLKQIEFAASKAGINDFLVNSAVNGLVHSTFKAGLMHPNVQGALRESKMFGWAFPKGSFNVTGTGANVSVSPKYGIGKQIFNIAKEPLGEFSEEYLQSISSATMQAGASNNIHQFIENKYNGDGSAQVGDQMAGDFAAAFSAMGDAFTSKESIKSGILGAISSSIGTPTFRARDYTKRVKNADGTYSTKIDFSRREGESRFEHITRLAPWRSGLVDAIRENNQTKRQLYDEAATLETWLRDPNNRAKFDGIVGTFSWAKQMGEAGASSDEFGYRNSLLGKTINDAFMLEKLRGTAYYDSFMKEVIQAANLEEGSQEAQKFIQTLRENIHTNNGNLSDSELLAQVKSNANKLLTTLDKINEHSDKIDRVLGNVDEDTKQALIYGEMSLRDWEGRSESLRTELDNISSTISTSREHSTANSNIKPLINRYGSITQAKKVKGQLSDTKRGLIEDIKTLESRQKNLTKTEKNILKEKKARLKAINQELSYLKDAEKLEDTADVLNEQEIMALSPLERARFLNKKNLSSFSQEQQAVITNLINEGTSKDIDFYSKVQDAGKIELATKTFLTQYNSILQDPQSFNAYVQRAKQAASDVLTKKRYEEVANIQEYKTFSANLDKLIDGSSEREQRMIIRALENSKSPNYLKYKENRKAIEGLVKQVLEDGTINLDENDASLFAQTLTYLSNNDVNFNDTDAVVTALSSVGSNGKTNFENYVDELNESIPELERTVFTSTGEVIQNFKDVLERYNKDKAEVEDNEKGVIVEPVTNNDNRPAPEVNATVNPGIFATASKSLEEAEADMKRSQDANTSETKDTKEDSNIEKLKENNSEEIINAYNTAVNAINNDKYSSKEVKDIALESLNNLVVGEYESTDEFAEAIIREANKLDVFGDKKTEDAAKVLRTASTIIKNAANKKKEETKEEPKKPVTDVRPLMQKNPNAAIAESLDIQYMKNQHPESPIVAFLEKHNVESFLQLNPLPKGTKVLFYIDEELTNSVRTSMGDTYTDNSLPLVAVVEHEKGTIDINGKKHQPIGVFPRTDNSNFNGSTRVGKVREFIGDTKTGLISKGGIPLEGTLNRVVAEKIEHLDKSVPNNNVVNLAENALTSDEKNTLNSIPKALRKGHYAYTKAKDFFLKHLSYKTSVLKSGNTSPKAYYFTVDNLKGDVFDVEVFVTPVSKTISTKSDKSIIELFNENNVAETLQANSRLERVSEVIKNAFKGIPSSENMTLASNEGKIEAVGDTKEAISTIEKTVSKNVNNHLFTGQSWSMSLTPSEKLTDTGDRIFTLSLVHTNGEEIQLGEVHRGELSDNEVFNILKNLITDNGNIRTYGGKELVKWQVEYTEDTKALENNGNVGRAYDDGILEVSVASLTHKVHGIQVNSPFNSNGEIINTGEVIAPTVANSDNASTNAVIDTPVVAPNNVVVTDNAVIDSDTGTVLQGEEPKVEKPAITEEVKAESAENNVDPYTGLPIGEVRNRSRKRERKGKDNSTNQPKFRVLPSRLSWGKWENLELENVEDLDLPYKEIDLEKEAKWLRKVLPQLSKNDRLVIAKGLINVGTKGLKAWGKFSDGIITLSDVAAEGTLYHEAFHAVFNLMLDSSERQALLAEARQMYGNKSDLALEEDLAEGFREYVMSRDTNNLLDKIKNFFKDLWIKVTNWNKIQPHLDAYYKRINDGYYGNKELGNFEGTRNMQEQYTEEIQSIKDKAIADGTFMKAPNGNPTNLTERQWLQVRTKAFKEWFGDWENNPAESSKVVNKNGEPLVVYHGGSNVKIFDTSGKARGGAGIKKGDIGTYFTTSESNAEFYEEIYSYKTGDFAFILQDMVEAGEITKEEADKSWELQKPNTRAFFLNIKNPKTREYRGNNEEGYTKVDTNVSESNDGQHIILEGKNYEEYVAFSPNQIKSATDNVGTFSEDNDDIRYRFIGEIGARNLDRENNSIAIGYNLITARNMDEAGKDPSIIKSITGWEKGVDGKWRYERMDQSKSVNIDLLLEGKQSYNLADLYRDKELYKEYPSLKYFTVEIIEDDERGGYLNFNDRVIALEKGNFEDYDLLVKSGQISKGDYTYAKEIAKIKTAKTLVHEIQHAIQTIENFAQGGSPSIVLPEDIAKLKKLYDQYSDAVDTFNNLPYQDRLTPYGKHLRDEAIRLENEYLTAHDNAKIGFEGYKRLAGEVESRNVEYRLDTDYKQRPPLRNLAKFTEDVDRESQIVLLEENTPWKATESVRYRLANGLSTIESEQIRMALEAKNYTEEIWNDLTPKEMEHELKCLGVNI